MPVLLALLGLAGAVAYWYFRVRGVANLFEMADDVRLAARRFSFSRRANVHPVDAVEDPRPLAAGTAAAIAEIAGPMTEAQLTALRREAARTFGTGTEETIDIVTFGRWLAGQCGAPDEAARRLTRRTRDRAGAEAGPDLARIVTAVLGGARPTDRQAEAIQRIRRDFTL